MTDDHSNQDDRPPGPPPEPEPTRIIPTARDLGKRAQPTRKVDRVTRSRDAERRTAGAIGAQIGAYRLLDEISTATGEADVYEAEDADGRHLALKLYAKSHIPVIEVLESLRGLQHPDVLELLDYDVWEDHWFEVYPLAEGGTAASRIPYTDEELIDSVVPQIVNGLEVLHELGIVHRDLKPENVFYLRAGESDLVIGDFGAARYRSPESNARYAVASTLFGTLGYVAPESLAGAVGPFTDFFALGMTILRLRGTDPLAWYESWDHWNIALHADEVELRAMVPENIGALIDGLLVRSFADRWGKDEVRRWLKGDSVAVVRRTGLRPLQWKGQRLHSLRQVSDYLLEESSEAGELLTSGSLKDWLVDSNNDIETWNRIRRETAKAESPRHALRQAAFAVDPERGFVTPHGDRLEALQDVYQHIDRHFDLYERDSVRQPHQLRLFLSHGVSGDVGERLTTWVREHDSLQAFPFLTRFLYFVNPHRPFRTLQGSDLPTTDDAAGDLKAIAEHVETDRHEYTVRFDRFAVELRAWIEARALTPQLRWLDRVVSSPRSDPEKLIALLAFFDPARGLRTPSGGRISSPRELGLELVARASDWIDSNIAAAEIRAFADTHRGDPIWESILERIADHPQLTKSMARDIAALTLRPTHPVDRIEIRDAEPRSRGSSRMEWTLKLYSRFRGVCAAESLPLDEHMAGPHAEEQVALEWDLSINHGLGRLPHFPDRNFDESLQAVEATLREQVRRESRRLARERAADRMRQVWFHLSPLVLGVACGLAPALAITMFRPIGEIAVPEFNPPDIGTGLLKILELALVFSVPAVLFVVVTTHSRISASPRQLIPKAVESHLLSLSWGIGALSLLFSPVAFVVLGCISSCIADVVHGDNKNDADVTGAWVTFIALVMGALIVGFVQSFLSVDDDHWSSEDRQLHQRLVRRAQAGSWIGVLAFLLAMLFTVPPAWIEAADRYRPATGAVESQGVSGDRGKGLTATVSASRLNVRDHPSTQAQVVRQLTRGTVVVIIESRDGWSLVEIRTSTGRVWRGWAASRYLRMQSESK